MLHGFVLTCVNLTFQGANSHGQLAQGSVSEQCELPQIVNTTWYGLVKEIACGGGHSLLLTDEGKLYACGWNNKRQLGFETEHCTAFTRSWDLTGIIFHKICCGWDSSAAITKGHIIYLWGSNAYGQLGLPRDDFPTAVKPIQLELKAKAVSMGLRHTALLDVNGSVWTTGCGKRGQLGHGESVMELDRFQKIETINQIDMVVCGQHHTLAWSAVNNALYAWGDNAHGQLGAQSDNSRICIPTQVTIFKTTDISNIYAGWTNSAILLSGGEAISWGRNNYGQQGCEEIPECGYNTIRFEEHVVRQLALGSEHTICRLSDNSLWAWGWNEHGNTGTGSSVDVKKPLKLNAIFKNILQISAGAGHNFVVTEGWDPSLELITEE